ncbi:MAG TPA: nuclear transport factor 2 family protein [Chthoniobacteraceae bacterium]|nr:nuclear transport factor 2 family protein [Chthoniobacteraceae bacterium]
MFATVEQRIGDLETRVDAMIARESIRDVLYRYCRAADRCDVELMRSCYHEDAIDDHGFISGSGWKFAEYVTAELGQIEASIHSLSNVLIDLDGSRAFSESQYVAVHRLRTPLGFTDFVHQGRYLDVWEQRESIWRISRRVICRDCDRWHRAADLEFLSAGKANTPPSGSHSARDPVYLHFGVPRLILERPKAHDLWRSFRILAVVPLWFVRAATVLLKPFYR